MFSRGHLTPANLFVFGTDKLNTRIYTRYTQLRRCKKWDENPLESREEPNQR